MERSVVVRTPLEEMDLDEILSYLSSRHLRFVGARLACTSDAEAADIVGLAPQSVYNWNNQTTLLGYSVKELINEVVHRYRAEYAAVARSRLLKLTHQAVDILEDAMKGRIRNNIQYQAAKEVLDRATPISRRVEHTGADGQSLPLVQNAIVINTVREILDVEVNGEVVDEEDL